jgi:hypothetical protein
MDKKVCYIAFTIAIVLFIIIIVFILSGQEASLDTREVDEPPAEGAENQNQALEGNSNKSPQNQSTLNPPSLNQSVVEPVTAKTNLASIGTVAKTQRLELTPWTDSKVSMEVSAGWSVYTGGECATKSILIRDPQSELKQLFYFSEAGPVYTSNEAKEHDEAYMAMGGSVLWYDSPVVSPMSSENYLKKFGVLASGDIFQEVFPQVPILENVEILSTEDQSIPSFAADAKLMRAEFTQNGQRGEGYFYVVTSDSGFGQGHGVIVIGITAPKGLLELLTPSLKESIASFSVDSVYVQKCIDDGQRALARALETGRILSETSDVIMDSWESKMNAEDRMVEKWSDAMSGVSRLYDPETDEVYEVTPEFFDYYAIHSDEFEMNYLTTLPKDKWSYAPLNGGVCIY